MKKVLVSRQMLPLSMMKAHTTGFPQQAAPCAPSMQPFYHAEPIPKVMLDVIFESDEIVVLREVLTSETYTLDKSRNTVMEEPSGKELCIYDHLDKLGIRDKDLNLHHWDTLNRLFEIGVISETQPGGTE